MSSLGDDPWLDPFMPDIRRREARAREAERRLTGGRATLADFASGHEYFGLHRLADGWVFREWAPHADGIAVIGAFSGWRASDAFALRRMSDHGAWELRLPPGALAHGDLYRLRVRWPGGEGDRIPAWARRVVQDDRTRIFNAQAWAPPPHAWRHPPPPRPAAALIYESHVGMAQERAGVGTYDQFRREILPRIADAGYNTVQLMALAEHPYYGSFGYQVSSYFAASSRFGTPEELKALVDGAHGMGLRVIMDLVHSHAAANEVEGLSRFDGTLHQYFHAGGRGMHPAWGSRCFDYGKPEVLHFLLSNCRFWLDEYRLDGFRFDGITSMLYHHRGLGNAFTSYAQYFDGSVDEDAVTYLTLANKVVHAVRPDAVTIAEDISGMPGLAAPPEDGGCGFDCRLAMGIPDAWTRLCERVPDEQWHMGGLWRDLTDRRADERTVSYAECHDQALVGDKTLIFKLIDAEMYAFMRGSDTNLRVDRGLALHKMIRLVTLATAGHGYLNFMGNEFGHPEWIDFPREGNNWSYAYARRQWHLRDDPHLKYRFLAEFDRAMLALCAAHGIPGSDPPMLLAAREEDKVLAFGRADLLFFFNFHAQRSLTDYAIEVPPGDCRLELDTDAAAFGGHARLAAGQGYVPAPVVETTAPGRRALRFLLRLYLPCRTALVLRRAPRPYRAYPPPMPSMEVAPTMGR